MQVSFRLLSQAMMIRKYKKDLDEQYLQAQKALEQKYVHQLVEARKNFIPLYKALEEEMAQLWVEVQEETGVDGSKSFAILEDGTLTRVNMLSGWVDIDG